MSAHHTQMRLWLEEIATQHGKIDRYVREEVINPFVADEFKKYRYIFCTHHHRYAIVATLTYLGCIATSTRWRPGEDWHRGNDLPDGPFCRETWEKIKNAIISYELLPLEEQHEHDGVKEDSVTIGQPSIEGGGISNDTCLSTIMINSGDETLCPIHNVPMVLRFYNRGPNDPPGNGLSCPKCVEENALGAVGMPGPCPCGQGYDDNGDGDCAVCGPEKENQLKLDSLSRRATTSVI